MKLIEYFVRPTGEEQPQEGPYTFAELQARFNAGSYGPQALVKREGLQSEEDWQPLGRIFVQQTMPTQGQINPLYKGYGMVVAFKKMFKLYATFRGRSTATEYSVATLSLTIIIFGLVMALYLPFVVGVVVVTETGIKEDSAAPAELALAQAEAQLKGDDPIVRSSIRRHVVNGEGSETTRLTRRAPDGQLYTEETTEAYAKAASEEPEICWEDVPTWALVLPCVLLGIYIIFSLVILLPGLSLCCRRLHDTGRSGHWQWLNLVPYGGIVVLVFCCMDSQRGSNQYGPSEKYLD